MQTNTHLSLKPRTLMAYKDSEGLELGEAVLGVKLGDIDKLGVPDGYADGVREGATVGK